MTRLTKEEAIEIARDETAELTVRPQMYKELAQYVAPKRKAIEVCSEEAGSVSIKISWAQW
ncbi:MAG TPA: hypothetical protein VHJ19_12990 [Gammaproteobacteria bacterium]|nr:hypothetical protein [Gammaproteobacteria bacterium]